MSKLDPTAFCWYRSDTQLGLMYVGVETSESEQANLQGPHCVFQQAALLSNTEVIIQAIELWQEIDLDLVPCDAPDSSSLHLSLQLQDNANTNANASATELEATSKSQVKVDESAAADTTDDSAIGPAEEGALADASEQVDGEQRAGVSGSGNASQSNAPNNQPRIVMVFDCTTLVQLKSLSPELQSVLRVTSSSIELRIQLDQLNIASEEMEKIENGAVVVIPAAYQPEWGIVAISTTPEVPLRFGGTVENGDQALQVQFAHRESSPSDNAGDNPVGSDATSDDTITVWCEQLCSIPVKDLLGIDAGNHTTPLFSLDARELKLVQGESTIAHGSLLSYGRGSVVAISESESERERLMD